MAATNLNYIYSVFSKRLSYLLKVIYDEILTVTITLFIHLNMYHISFSLGQIYISIYKRKSYYKYTRNPKPLLYLKKSSQLNRIDQKPSCLHWHVSIFNDDYFKQQCLHVKIKCTCRLRLSLDNRTYLFNIINVSNRLFLFDICSFQPKYQKLLHEHRGNAGKFYDTQYLF